MACAQKFEKSSRSSRTVVALGRDKVTDGLGAGGYFRCVARVFRVFTHRVSLPPLTSITA